MALVEIKLHVIYALIQSDWLAQNLELVPGIPSMSTHTYYSFPPPANLPTRIRIRGKICLARETSVPEQRRTVQIAYPQRDQDSSVFFRDSVCVRVFVCV